MQHLLLFITIFIFTILWFRWRWKKTNIFKELKIPGPEPSFWFGNILELYEKGLLECKKDWFKKYGKVVGYYYGMRPILLVSDPELLKKIFIRDSHIFLNRPEAVPLRSSGIVDYCLPTRTLFDSLLVNLKGERWKKVRKILTTTFSAAKMKLMIPIMKDAIQIIVSNIAEKAKSGEAFEIYDLFRRLSLDIICQTAFAVKTNIQTDKDDSFFKSAKLMFGMPYKSNLMLLGACFPEIATLVMIVHFVRGFIQMGGVIPPFKFTWMIGDVIKYRRKTKENNVDLLQLMIEASDSQIEDETALGRRNGDHTDSTTFKEKYFKLTDKEIQANALLVFLAGFETTSTVLAYVFHLLVKYPEFQDKLRMEIDDIMDGKEDLDYTSVSQLKLLDRFFLETMRLYPPVTNFINRVATKDVSYGDITIRKGMQVQLPICYLHSNSEHWPNAEVFDPDRFLPENRPDNFTVTYVAFGTGPRNCLGMRFATMEAKLAIAKLLHRFEFFADEKDLDLQIEVRQASRIPTNVLVKARERN